MGDHRLLGDFSIEELEKEIERRKSEEPQLLQKIDWSNVVHYMRNAVLILNQGMGLRDDFEDQLKILVLEAMYGHSILAWWRHKLKNQ